MAGPAILRSVIGPTGMASVSVESMGRELTLRRTQTGFIAGSKAGELRTARVIQNIMLRRQAPFIQPNTIVTAQYVYPPVFLFVVSIPKIRRRG